MEALADASGHEEELAAIYEDELDRLPPVETAQVALRLGALHEEKLGEPSRAATFYRKARRARRPPRASALPALERLYRSGSSAGTELAYVLDAARRTPRRAPERVQLLFRLGQLCEERLAAPDRAAEALRGRRRGRPAPRPVAARARGARTRAPGGARTSSATSPASATAPGDAAARERVLAKMAALAAELGRLDESVALWKELLAARAAPRGGARRARGCSTSGSSAGRISRSTSGCACRPRWTVARSPG